MILARRAAGRGRSGRGEGIVMTAGRLRRIVSLSCALRRCTVGGAGLREGELRIRFAPDPGLWPRGK
ncbi:hypothetical protein ACWGI9_07575 [Streptomyces sp. NPDC054833]